MIKKSVVRGRVFEILSGKFPAPTLHYKDVEEPTDDNPIIRLVLVSSFFDEMDTRSKQTFLIIRDILSEAGLFEEFNEVLVVVMPMGRKEYVANGNSIFAPKPEDDDDKNDSLYQEVFDEDGNFRT